MTKFDELIGETRREIRILLRNPDVRPAFSLDELTNNDIRTAFLKTGLKGVIEGGSLIHVINDERNA